MGILDSLKKIVVGGNERYYHDALGLAPEEEFKAITTCSLWREPTSVGKVEAFVMSLLSILDRTVVGSGGVQVTIGITTAGRFVLGMVQGDSIEPQSFVPGEGKKIVDTGRSAAEKMINASGQLETATILSLIDEEGELFQLIMPKSKAAEFSGWS